MLYNPAQHCRNRRTECASLQHESPMRRPFHAEVVGREPEVIVTLARPCSILSASHNEQRAGQRLDDNTPLSLVPRQPRFTANRSQGNQALLTIQVRHGWLLIRVATRD